MKGSFWSRVTIGFVVVAGLLVAGAAPGDAWTGHGGFHGGGFRGGGFPHVGFHRGFHHHRSFFHHPCCFGPRVFIGVGVGVPLVYPYGYPVYSPPVVVESAPPAYVQPEQQYWYYCQDAHAYYPYVTECPSGWQQVIPQASPPSQ